MFITCYLLIYFETIGFTVNETKRTVLITNK